MKFISKIKGAKKIYLALGSVATIIATPMINRAIDDLYNQYKYPENTLIKIGSDNRKMDIIRELDPEDAKFYSLKSTYKKIKNWSKENGECDVEFSISSVDGDYLMLDLDEMVERKDDEIFEEKDYLEGKSKYEMFAEQLESRDPKVKNFVDKILKKRCKNNEIITLHWRNQIREESVKSVFKDMQNVWLDEKTLNVKVIYY